MKEIFLNLTIRPDKNLFYRRNDKNDKRLGEIVNTNIKDYKKSGFVILGSPQDLGVKRNKGRTGAKLAPDKIRESFYKLSANQKLIEANIFDLGNIKIQSSLEKTHDIQEKIVYQILKDGKKIIILGGGNDISYPDCKGLSKFNKNILALNIDSHFDVRTDKKRNSGTSYRMLLEEEIIKGENFFEIGIKPHSASPVYEKYLKEKKSFIYDYYQTKEIGIKNLLHHILLKNKSAVIFFGFDMDSVKASDAPGVSAPNPIGFTSDDAIDISIIAGQDDRTKIFEISEVNPKFDIDNTTSRLAAVMIWNFLNSSNNF